MRKRLSRSLRRFTASVLKYIRPPNVPGFDPGIYGDWARNAEFQKKNYPIRAFLCLTVPDMIDQCSYNLNRFKSTFIQIVFLKHRRVVMHQLEKGSWYDADERMFHACFQLLVDYVEFELAGENYEWYDRHLKHRSTGRFGQMLRNPDAGLDFLNQLVGDENPLRMVKVSTDRYSEIRYLYVWYTQIRPKRGNLWDRTIKSRLVQNIIDLRETAQSLDTFYEREDQDKLKHLIDLRSSLWT